MGFWLPGKGMGNENVVRHDLTGFRLPEMGWVNERVAGRAARGLGF